MPPFGQELGLRVDRFHGRWIRIFKGSIVRKELMGLLSHLMVLTKPYLFPLDS